MKRFGNAELSDRRVIAQVVDYSAALASLGEAELCRAFGAPEASSWAEAIAAIFPSAASSAALARTLLDKLRGGEVTLIVACDVAPDGIAAYIEAAAQQRALAFQLRLVEVTPYRSDSPDQPVIFVPAVPIETKIIARTCVVIRDHSTGGKVLVQVTTDSAEEIQAAEKPKRQPASAQDTEVLTGLDEALGLAAGTSLAEMRRFTRRALEEDWSEVLDALCWPDEERRPIYDGRRGERWSRWGRYGINVGSPSWMPGVFIGWMLRGHDHRVELLAEAGPDFVVVLNRNRSEASHGLSADDLIEQPEWVAMRDRLAEEAPSPLRFHDHLREVSSPNLWHPIHLRAPMVQLFEGADDSEERYRRWLSLAQRAASAISAGGEMARLRERWLREHA